MTCYCRDRVGVFLSDVTHHISGVILSERVCRCVFPLSHHHLLNITPPPSQYHTTTFPISHYHLPTITPPPSQYHTTTFPISHHHLPNITLPPSQYHTTTFPLSHHHLPTITLPPSHYHTTTFPLSHYHLPTITLPPYRRLRERSVVGLLTLAIRLLHKESTTVTVSAPQLVSYLY